MQILRDPTILGPSHLIKYHIIMFKKLLFPAITTLIIASISIYLAVLYRSTSAAEVAREDIVLGVEKQSVFIEIEKPTFAPSRVVIPVINIDALLVKVNLSEDGALEAPQDWNVGGWYSDSSKAGEKGNIVIDGHYDTNTGAPAAFWSLKNVKTGDIVTLVDEMGRSFSYEVSEVFYIDIDDPNRLQIFDENSDLSHVTLITCGGVWLPGHFTYSKRLVVKANIIE